MGSMGKKTGRNSGTESNSYSTYVWLVQRSRYCNITDHFKGEKCTPVLLTESISTSCFQPWQPSNQLVIMSIQHPMCHLSTFRINLQLATIAIYVFSAFEIIYKKLFCFHQTLRIEPNVKSLLCNLYEAEISQCIIY